MRAGAGHDDLSVSTIDVSALEPEEAVAKLVAQNKALTQHAGRMRNLQDDNRLLRSDNDKLAARCKELETEMARQQEVLDIAKTHHRWVPVLTCAGALLLLRLINTRIASGRCTCSQQHKCRRALRCVRDRDTERSAHIANCMCMQGVAAQAASEPRQHHKTSCGGQVVRTGQSRSQEGGCRSALPGRHGGQQRACGRPHGVGQSQGRPRAPATGRRSQRG